MTSDVDDDETPAEFTAEEAAGIIAAVREMLYDYALPVRPPVEFVERIMDARLMAEVEDWGATDTVVRERIVDRAARALLGDGASFPKYSASDAVVAEFNVRLAEACKAWEPAVSV